MTKRRVAVIARASSAIAIGAVATLILIEVADVLFNTGLNNIETFAIGMAAGFLSAMLIQPRKRM